MSAAPSSVQPGAEPQHETPRDVRSEADAGAATRALVKQVMRQQAKSVVVITAGLAAPVGFCATSLAPVSLDPPVLSFALAKRTRSWATIATADRVMAHLLAEDQEELAQRFAQRNVAKFGPGTCWHRDAHGLPVLDGVLARMLLSPVKRVDLGEHALVICKVDAVDNDPVTKRPLLHYGGHFRSLADARLTVPWP